MKKHRGGITAVKRRYGALFVAPWTFGVIVFVVVPLFRCFYYSLSDVVMAPEGLQTSYVGLAHYKELFFTDPYYLNDVAASLSGLFTSVPLVVALSMILAILLNQKFRGRLLARAVFFLPVIIASGAVMDVLTDFSMTSDMMGAAGGAQNAEYMQVMDFSRVFAAFDLPKGIADLLEGYLQDVFNLIWNCGVPILLFVAGLQTIPAQLYEVGRVEGITAWEEFWYVTVPMMGRVIVLAVFYTMVELFITEGPVVKRAVLLLTQDMRYSASSAMLWPYFALVGAVMGLFMPAFNRLCLRKWE